MEIDLVQLVADELMAENRADGLGFGWGWASARRPWMDVTASKYAYRCLPIVIMNQLGLWITNPIGFSCLWTGGDAPHSIDFLFDDVSDETASLRAVVSNHFGQGIITWNTPFLFCTRPAESRLLVMGPANYFRCNVQPMVALIESDWMRMSFTMNWKVLLPHVAVRFEPGEPIVQVIPFESNVVKDLTESKVNSLRLRDNPRIEEEYNDWSSKRTTLLENQKNGLDVDAWQKDYFLGKQALGCPIVRGHATKVKYPPVHQSDGVGGS